MTQNKYIDSLKKYFQIVDTLAKIQNLKKNCMKKNKKKTTLILNTKMSQLKAEQPLQIETKFSTTFTVKTQNRKDKKTQDYFCTYFGQTHLELDKQTNHMQNEQQIIFNKTYQRFSFQYTSFNDWLKGYLQNIFKIKHYITYFEKIMTQKSITSSYSCIMVISVGYIIRQTIMFGQLISRYCSTIIFNSKFMRWIH